MLLQQEVQFVGFAASRSSVKGSSFNASSAAAMLHATAAMAT